MWPSTGGSDSSCTEDLVTSLSPSSAGIPGGRSAVSPSPSPPCPAAPWWGSGGRAATWWSRARSPAPLSLRPLFGPLPRGLDTWPHGAPVGLPEALTVGRMAWRLGGNMENGEQYQRYHRRFPGCTAQPPIQSRAVSGLPAPQPGLALPTSPHPHAPPLSAPAAPMLPSVWFEALNHNWSFIHFSNEETEAHGLTGEGSRGV